jgi:hypothetical protein
VALLPREKRTVFPGNELAEVAMPARGENEEAALGPDNLMGEGSGSLGEGRESFGLHTVTVS